MTAAFPLTNNHHGTPMIASDSTVRLIPRANGDTGIHDYYTGKLLGVLPACAIEPKPLADQIETVTVRRERERSQDMVAGLVLGTAFVAGVVVGVLITYL